MSERATRTNWRQPIAGHKSNSGGRKGWKQAEKPTLTEQGIDVDEFIRENHAGKEEPVSQGITANAVTAPEKQCENPRDIIANALVGIYDSISALQHAAYQANDKVVYMYATKLMNGELMDLKANYSKASND